MNGDTPILHVIARFAVPFTVLVGIRIFFQGHDLPGGGFIAGVLFAAAGAMAFLAFGVGRAARLAWWRVSVLGLLVSLSTGIAPMLGGHAYLDNTILHLGSFHLPTATFFDLGVAMIVFGTLMTIFVELAQERR